MLSALTTTFAAHNASTADLLPNVDNFKHAVHHFKENIHEAVQEFKDDLHIDEMTEGIYDLMYTNVESDLPADATAQWSAGLLYGWTERRKDKRDYIVGCSEEWPRLNNSLNAAFDSFNADDVEAGNQQLADSRFFWRLSMWKCWKTNHKFSKKLHKMDHFYARDDASDIIEANYNANKDSIDQQWGFMLKSFNEGVYFNAGMFYAEIGNILMAHDSEETAWWF